MWMCLVAPHPLVPLMVNSSMIFPLESEEVSSLSGEYPRFPGSIHAITAWHLLSPRLYLPSRSGVEISRSSFARTIAGPLGACSTPGTIWLSESVSPEYAPPSAIAFFGQAACQPLSQPIFHEVSNASSPWFSIGPFGSHYPLGGSRDRYFAGHALEPAPFGRESALLPQAA